MSSPFVLCPHCHTPVNPAAMDTACSPVGEWRICPVCDEPVFFEPAPKKPADVAPAAPALPVEV